MKMISNCYKALLPPTCGFYLAAFLALGLAGFAQAHEPITQSGVQIVQPGVQGLRPGQLGRTHSHSHSQTPGQPHQHVRQRVEYGKGFRYGHRVSGPEGDIIIWSPTTNNSFGAQPRPQFGPRHRPRPHPPTGPRLHFKPEYGEPPKSGRD